MRFDLEDVVEDRPVYEFPKRFARRKRTSYVVLPLLFYGSLLVGLAISGPEAWTSQRLLLYLFLFLTAVMGLFMLLIYTSRPWVVVFHDRVRVGSRELPIGDLTGIMVYMDRRMMFERPPYQLIFVVRDPDGGQVRYTSEAIRNVQDLDTLVRDLRELLPDVEFWDRSLTGGSTVGPEALEGPRPPPGA